MVVVKWILLLGLIGLATWLIIDLIIAVVKLIKKKRLAKKVHNNMVENNDKE